MRKGVKRPISVEFHFVDGQALQQNAWRELCAQAKLFGSLLGGWAPT